MDRTLEPYEQEPRPQTLLGDQHLAQWADLGQEPERRGRTLLWRQSWNPLYLSFLVPALRVTITLPGNPREEFKDPILEELETYEALGQSYLLS